MTKEYCKAVVTVRPKVALAVACALRCSVVVDFGSYEEAMFHAIADVFEAAAEEAAYIDPMDGTRRTDAAGRRL